MFALPTVFDRDRSETQVKVKGLPKVKKDSSSVAIHKQYKSIMIFNSLTVLALLAAPLSQAYVLPRPTSACAPSSFVGAPRTSVSPTVMDMSAPEGASDNNNQDPVDTEEAPAPKASVEEEEEEEEEAAPPEDPEVVAIKEEISKLESELKERRRKLDAMEELADTYTKTGYARRVAEMENMRRARGMLQSSDRDGSTAAILIEFLPVLDRLEALRNQYSGDGFGQVYNALPDIMQKAMMEDLGVTEFVAEVGQPSDPVRFDIVASEHDATAPANTILRPVTEAAPGLELRGNVIRRSVCVASLGPEVEASEEDGPKVFED